VRSLIARPSAGAELRGSRVEIAGVAWSGEGPIVRVDVSAEAGATWTTLSDLVERITADPEHAGATSACVACASESATLDLLALGRRRPGGRVGDGLSGFGTPDETGDGAPP
jgi:hypothetical protein